jgi:hypothetical protein
MLLPSMFEDPWRAAVEYLVCLELLGTRELEHSYSFTALTSEAFTATIKRPAPEDIPYPSSIVHDVAEVDIDDL